ncbi:MAG TPA: FAD:protein FMN transferase [Chloroflexota bacterium]
MSAQAMAALPQSAPAAPDFDTPAGMGRHAFSAMGTTVNLLLPDGGGLPAEQAQALFAEWEGALSRFRADSELSYLNGQAGRPVVVGPLLWTVLTASLEAARSTRGVYDPTMLRQLEAAGYDRTFQDLPRLQPAPVHPTTAGGAWRRIRLDKASRTVTLPSEVALDFGGIAKGMAVDAALDVLVSAGLTHAVVEAGGDLRVHGHPPGQPGWQVAVHLPNREWQVTVHDGAIATSTLSRRRWQQGGVERHHILDPRSGQPAHSGLWSVTVSATSCVQADVAAKTAFILGAGDGRRFLSRHGLAALLVKPDGATERVGGWPAETASAL